MSIEARFYIDRGEFCLDVDLEFPERGVSAIFGSSGSGKTTLLRAIAGLEPSHNGTLKVGGSIWQDEHHFLPPHLRSIGYVFQEPSLFTHLNAYRNIEYGRQRIPDNELKISVNEVVELLGITDLLHRYPHQLSGGEQQRVAIARALATCPDVLLMDEPLAALDSARKQEILPYLESLHQELDIPIIYVSHSKEEVMRMGDHMVLLDQGKALAIGSVTELFSRLDLSMAHDSDAQCVIETVVAEHDTEFALSYLTFSGGRFSVSKLDRTPGCTVRLLIKASDVSITLQRAPKTSILNIFPATVKKIAEEGGSQMIAQLMLGSSPIIAKITRKSATLLNLQPGMNIFVQIKSVALLS